MLEVTDLHVSYGNIEAVRGVGLTVEPERVTLVLGANGAGKSTTLKAIAGLQKPHAGTVRLDGRDITGQAPHRIVRQGVALVPEGRRVFAPISVAENLRLGGYAADKSAFADTLAKVYDMFPILADRRSSPAGLLSGGEQQMLAFGRALMSQPEVMLLDEPSMGLAPVVIDAILAKVAEMAQAGIGILMVEQNAQAGLDIADRVVAIARGEVVYTGESGDARNQASVLRAFLGEAALADRSS
ncbi:branched-chain amino acid transport system ATP-binding protein [Kribbella sp. VKM Ac-2527]|uniref:Branched-chain amino acid transport system ATP-binding protein n=1 Tax=Kribbella caucasensis TaxID=2512215 RepID=A0A4R6KHS3_9ACTN|nr:ABC transporter ATP-binding protein [Kribbella sp. VKM Ac-2527]TDO48694.1 branched-chain amino acid transport system ATP-binding protein [Kribbella sp. VKM Ac-2527]